MTFSKQFFFLSTSWGLSAYHLLLAAMVREEATAFALLNTINNDNNKDGVALMHHLSDTVAVHALFHACAQGKLLVIQQMSLKHLHLFTARNKDGHTLLHVAASNGNTSAVSLLLQIKPELCFIRDDHDEIPLHSAAKNGHRDVVEMLLLAYPDSIGTVNFRLETALHLALKSCETSTALFLLREIERQTKQHLLHFKDAEGNSVLHIAVTKELVPIVQWLFSCKSHEDMMMTLMNAKNHRNLTLLDIYCREPEDCHQEYSHQKTNPQKQTNLGGQSYEKDNIRLTVAIGNVGVAFAVLTNLPAVFQEEPVKQTYSLTDLVSANLPANFYLLLFVVAMFIAGVIEVGNVIWPHPLRKSLLVTTACTWVIFYLLVENQILRFSVWINGGLSISISSSCLLWSSALFLILLMYFAIKCGGYIGSLVASIGVKEHHIDLEAEDMSMNSVVEQYV